MTIDGLRRWLAASIAPKVKPQAQARSMYAGALFSRLSPDIARSQLRSAADETRYDLRVLRDRARNLDRNSPFGKRYSQLTAEKVIGECGLKLRAKNMLWDGSALHRTANRNIESAWCDWSLPENCGVTHTLSLTELLALAVMEWATDGEILIRLYEGSAFGPYGFQVQVLDPDLLDETLNETAPGGNIVRQGVEFDSYGAPVAYHLWTSHPSDWMSAQTRKHIRVPADQIIHTFIPVRAGQVRGVPHVAAMLNIVNSIDSYLDSEVNAAWVAAAKMGALEDIQGPDGPPVPPSRGVDEQGNPLPVLTDVSNASMLDLRGTGAKLSLWDPQHPTSAAPEFVRMMSHYIAMGYGISYATFFGDLSQSNYTSMRAGRLDEDDHWDRLRGFITTHVMPRLYRAWLRNALLRGRIPGVTDLDVNRWTRVSWQGAGRWKVDPLKDTQADEMEVGDGWSSPQRKAAERGVDFEEVLEEIAEARDLIAEYDLDGIVTIGPRGTPKPDRSATESSTSADVAANDAASTDTKKPVRMRKLA